MSPISTRYIINIILFNHQRNPFTIGTWTHICVTWSSTDGIVYYAHGDKEQEDATFGLGIKRSSGGQFVIGQVLIINRVIVLLYTVLLYTVLLCTVKSSI